MVLILPVERRWISVSQLAELLGIEPERFRAIERSRSDSTGVTLVLEPDMQTTGTNPPIHSNMSYGKGGGSAKTPKKSGGKK